MRVNVSPGALPFISLGVRGPIALIRAWVTDWEFSGGAGRLLSVYQLAMRLSVILHRDLGGVLLTSAPLIYKDIYGGQMLDRYN